MPVRIPPRHPKHFAQHAHPPGAVPASSPDATARQICNSLCSRCPAPLTSRRRMDTTRFVVSTTTSTAAAPGGTMKSVTKSSASHAEAGLTATAKCSGLLGHDELAARAAHRQHLWPSAPSTDRLTDRRPPGRAIKVVTKNKGHKRQNPTPAAVTELNCIFFHLFFHFSTSFVFTF